MSIKVVASPGMQCPMEDKPRAYITDTEAVDVPETAYYVRLIADGSLIPAPEASQKTKKGE